MQKLFDKFDIVQEKIIHQFKVRPNLKFNFCSDMLSETELTLNLVMLKFEEAFYIDN